jgi:cytochrome c oxidase subunit 1
MTLVTPPPVTPSPITTRPYPVRPSVPGSAVARILRTTDAKQIGLMYLVTSFAFFFIGGLMALLMRSELAEPGMFFATPVVFAFANYIVPLQIGAPDVSFPRLNAFAYWLFLFGGSLTLAGFATPGGAADFGWFAYAPLNSATNSPGVGANMWIVGVAISGVGTILGAVNMITTIFTLRAPGMTMFRMPIFTWNILITALLVLLIFPFLAAAALALAADRLLGAHIYDAATGGPMLWQHLFWFFGHPEVYVIALPFFGIISEIVPVFSRKPLFGYKGMVAATLAIAALSMSVWAHHMYATGQVLLPFFAFMTFLIAVPTGIKFFNWIGTMWKGQLTFETPMLFALGFLTTFLFGGLSGVLLASPPIDWHVSDSYFVVAHFHYTLFGTIVFAVFGGVYFWFPKMTGRMLDDRLGKVHFWLTLIGFHTTFLVMHWLGNEGMPRRYADYQASDGWTGLNQIATAGSFILAVSTLPFLYNVWKSYRAGPTVEVDDPWGFGMSLEWATSCPPPLRNFNRLPRIRSERPAFDAKFPELARPDRAVES